MAAPGVIPFRSGPLRHVVEIHAIVNEAAAQGGSKPTQGSVARRPAEVRPLSARELERAAQTQMRATWQVRMRYFLGLTTKHRIVWVDRGVTRTFGIESVIDTDARHREHLCLVTESA